MRNQISCRSYGWPVVNSCLQAFVFNASIHTDTLSLSYTHTHTHTHTHSLSLSLSLSHTHSLSHSHFVSLSLSLSLSPSLYNAWFLLRSLLIRSVFRISFFCNILVEIICKKIYEIMNLTSELIMKATNKMQLCTLTLNLLAPTTVGARIKP